MLNELVKGIDKKLVNEMYKSLSIHNKRDIAIDVNDICKILNKKPGKFLKEIISDIEYKLVTKKLNNDKDTLTKYIIENYS